MTKVSGRITEALLRDRLSGESVTVVPRMVVSATGAWAGQVGRLADVDLRVILSKGSLLVASSRLVRAVVNRCRPPASGDILVPGGPVTLLGTTSVETADPSDTSSAEEEVTLLRDEAAKLVPAAGRARILRAFAGVRPLYQQTGPAADGRAVSRGHAVIDHLARDGLGGMVSIVGGKLTTYRKMAEDVCAVVCRQLGVDEPCRTAELPLPGSAACIEPAPDIGVSPRTLRMARIRHGSRAEQVLARGSAGHDDRLSHLCLCESVTEAEVRHATEHLWARTVDDVRRRTRVGCGPCQGTYCGPRVSSVIAEQLCASADEERALEAAFLAERQKGVSPSAEGAQLVQEALRRALVRSMGLPGGHRET
jgi:glycerol-3-phosphate dehydrogenase